MPRGGRLRIVLSGARPGRFGRAPAGGFVLAAPSMRGDVVELASLLVHAADYFVLQAYVLAGPTSSTVNARQCSFAPRSL